MTKAIKDKAETAKKKCGIIMPIASCQEYTLEHWKDVLSILIEAISETEFEPRLVSDDVAIGLIHDRIVTNIYNDDIIVCDVSSKNPNVMFELGLRLAFDKPTIIIKDEKTGYSFDTGVIEHITYPSSLRFGQIVEFKTELKRRIEATYAKSQAEPNYSPFLKSFGKTIIPATIQHTEIPEGKYILEQLESLKYELKHLRMQNSSPDKNLIAYKFNDKRLLEILDQIVSDFDNDSSLDTFSEEFSKQVNMELNKRGFYMGTIELKDLIYRYNQKRLIKKLSNYNS